MRYLVLAAITALACATGFWSTGRFMFEPTVNLGGRWRDSRDANIQYVIEQAGVQIVTSTAQPQWCTKEGITLNEPGGDAPISYEAWRGILEGETVHAALTARCDPSQPAWEPMFIHIEMLVSGGDDLRSNPPLIHMIRLNSGGN